MRVMLDTNILVSLIFFPSAVTRDFARRVGFGNRIVLCDYVVEELRLVVKENFRTERRFWNSSSMNYPLSWFIRQKS